MTKQQNIKSYRDGFTIIEVVLVLAIAGLIFMMVFLALPALQRGQRNTQRQNDVGIVGAAIQSFMSANRGAAPRGTVRPSTGHAAAGVNNTCAINDGGATGNHDFCDFVGEVSAAIANVRLYNDINANVTLSFNDDARAVMASEIRVYPHAMCDGEEVVRSGSRNSAAVVTVLEQGGARDRIYCQSV